jgi:hypothetical protein
MLVFVVNVLFNVKWDENMDKNSKSDWGQIMVMKLHMLLRLA